MTLCKYCSKEIIYDEEMDEWFHKEYDDTIVFEGVYCETTKAEPEAR